MIILASYEIDPSLCEIVKNIKKVIELIEENKWYTAKTVWIIDVVKIMPKRRVFDCEDNEYNMFIQFLRPFQKFELYCGQNQCALKNVAVKTKVDLYFSREQNNKFVLTTLDNCSNCGANLLMRFLQTPPWLIIQIGSDDLICFDEFSKKLNLDSREYTHLCSTIVSPNIKNHFCAIFEIEGRSFLIDDLNSQYSENIPNVHKVSTCFYFLSK